MSLPAESIGEVQARGNDAWWTVVAACGMGVGAVLRLWQYLARSSLWLDEAALARNVLDRSVGELLAPLDYAQSAPPLFLVALKAGSQVLSPSESALRALPFVCGLAAVPAMWLLARRVLGPRCGAIAAWLFALSLPGVYYSAILKPYSCDLFVTLVVLLIAEPLIDARRRSTLAWSRAVALGILGIALTTLSHAAMFALAAAGLVIAVEALRERRQDRRARGLVAAMWVIGGLSVVMFARHNMPAADRIYMDRRWAMAFMPTHPVSALRWFLESVGATFSGGTHPPPHSGSLGYPRSLIWAAFALLGAGSLRTRYQSGLLLGTVVLALAASAARVYPFGGRFTLFLIPLWLLLLVAGVDRARLILPASVARWAVVCLPLVALVALARNPPPQRPEDMRPVMEHLARHARESDVVWVYYGAGQAFEYYRKLMTVPGELIIGSCARTDPRDYLRQLDALRQYSRVWVVMSHASAQGLLDERGFIEAYLQHIGNCRDRFPALPGQTPDDAFAMLCDLTSSRNSADDGRFPVPKLRNRRAWGCYGPVSPLRSHGR